MTNGALTVLAVCGMALTHPAVRRRTRETVLHQMGFVSLRTLAVAEVDFRGNDRDCSRINDFWTTDIVGLYPLTPERSLEMIKLLEISVDGIPPKPWVVRLGEWLNP